jgi:hypothetical protein
MPLLESLTGDICAHDDMVLDALRETILSPMNDTQGCEASSDLRLPWGSDSLRPVVLSRRGGLALTQFSQV